MYMLVLVAMSLYVHLYMLVLVAMSLYVLYVYAGACCHEQCTLVCAVCISWCLLQSLALEESLT